MILDCFVGASKYLVETKNKKYLVSDVKKEGNTTLKSSVENDDYRNERNGKGATKKKGNKVESSRDYRDVVTDNEDDLMMMLSDKFKSKVALNKQKGKTGIFRSTQMRATLLKTDKESKLSTVQF